jgi:hypothetical protein
MIATYDPVTWAMPWDIPSLSAGRPRCPCHAFAPNAGWRDGLPVKVDGNFYANSVIVIKIVTHSKNAIWGARAKPKADESYNTLPSKR